MQKQKNIRLLIILGSILTLISIIPILLESNDGLSIDKHQFTLDEQTVITDVILKSKAGTNKLSYLKGSWQVNDKYDLDQNMRDVFFSVLSQLEIRRSVSELQNDSIANLAKSGGIEVLILNNQEVLKTYWILGDSESQISYLTDSEDNSYVIHIPGYRSYLAGIFEVPESDWRSRRVFSALFTNLNSLKISYQKEDIEFQYKNRFFEILEINADSTQLITALENLLFLQTDKYLQPQEYSTYIDTPSEKEPLAKILVTKLSGTEEKMDIYKSTEESTFYLGIGLDSTYCLINKKRLDKILVKKSDFQ